VTPADLAPLDLALAGLALLVSTLCLGILSTILGLRFHELAAESGFDRDLASKPAVILVLGWTATFDIVDRDAWVGEHRPELARVLLWIRRLNLAALVALSLSLSISVLAYVSLR
jgi:hypothetical protein